jgi:hypothetical protein
VEIYIFRNATVNDVPFLVETIIEAEKSGTDKLSYTTIFRLTEVETRKYLTEMFLEQVDGCSLSVSSFLCAEFDGKVIAAVSEWIEGIYGIPSTVLKGNLLSNFLPKGCLENAFSLNYSLPDLQHEYTPNTIQLGDVYVLKAHQGNNLARLLALKKIELLLYARPDITEAFAQVFDCNIPSIKTCTKMDFKEFKIRECKDKNVMQYLPSCKKILFRKELFTT